jgi:hypothetical protein
MKNKLNMLQHFKKLTTIVTEYDPIFEKRFDSIEKLKFESKLIHNFQIELENLYKDVTIEGIENVILFLLINKRI